MASRGFSAWPEAVHFHSSCPFDGQKVPAILAPVNHVDTGHVVAVWRIGLTLTGEKMGRLGLGPTKGNCPRLYFPEGDELGLTEGAEDALSFRELSGLPTWAALSAGNMRTLTLPTRIRRIVISADSDPVGLNAAQALARRLLAEGRSVRIVRAIAHKDANDVLRARRAS